ncbi:methyltetrahydrofolate cobalamin methyltransferase [Clostridium magnum]|uniref:5-methyltetrahydrofolate:corrinoid/iron-sulfur protein co-methyltransferase n=1 Tax=Clostridium magnum DSM 2767 TaxID=1121326 RepID=A0A162R1S3_9CLOT|nr:methyltetrahydrofolate cobalamin methyltransferase [Clostridium magnum]KZL89295.1 5-methyltetrahydrofolate:corrinoid/iron-sulfur protein co-methyltransferase [Clostridium magnum DSM 2767]SHI95602.1 5-methyltetrahydrofolate--homocysteine methyltransferase [Clostridium magnum DSM 2767]
MLIIGELINTSRKAIREAVEKKDGQYIQQIAKAQEEAGATYIDVNCGTFMETEVETMEWLVENVLQATTLPLCIDSPNPLALEAGLKKAINGKSMINSITDETPRWNAILPLVKEYNTKIVALCIDDGGMPKTNEDRIRIADTIINKLTAEGVNIDDIYIDPLIKPISAGEQNGIEVLQAIQHIMESHPGVHTTCGLSNISYALPARKVLNRLFMVQTMARGMDSYIMDPTNKEMRAALLASQTLLGQDRFSRKFLKGFRQGLYE